MEVRKPKIKALPYEEFKDNESLEKIVDELHEGALQEGAQRPRAAVALDGRGRPQAERNR